MTNILQIVFLRLRMTKNFLYERLNKSPSLISLVIIIPIILYIIVELSTSSDISEYAINPNIIELLNSYNVFFHQLIYYTLIITAPIYILLSQINVRSYFKYKNINITFKEISLANLFIFLTIMDILTFAFIIMTLLKTTSTFISIIIFMLIFIISLNIIVSLLFLFYQMLTNFIKKMIPFKRIVIIESAIVLISSLIMVYITGNIPYNVFMSISPLIIIISLVLLTILFLYLYKRTIINNELILRYNIKKEIILNFGDNISCLKNYFLMIFEIKTALIEFALTIIIFYLISKLSSISELVNDNLLQIIIPFFLISNGAIYANKNWYHMHNNKTIKKTLGIDMFYSMLSMIIILPIIYLSTERLIQYPQLIICVSTYFFITLIQRIIQLEFKNYDKSPIIFILVLGFITYILYSLLNWVITYV